MQKATTIALKTKKIAVLTAIRGTKNTAHSKGAQYEKF